jgi:hypothetical protein
MGYELCCLMDVKKTCTFDCYLFEAHIIAKSVMDLDHLVHVRPYSDSTMARYKGKVILFQKSEENCHVLKRYSLKLVNTCV